MEICRFCIHQGQHKNGGCRFGGEEPIVPNSSEQCVFIKSEGVSRFERDPRHDQHGKMTRGYDSGSAPAPEFRVSKAPDDGGKYSIVCRQDRGSFKVDKNGNCFSDCADMKPIGHISDFDGETASEEEMRESILWLRNRMREML